MRDEDGSPTAQAIETWLVVYLADLLGVEPDEIDIREPFESYGLSSKDAVILSGDLEVWLERRLEPTLAWAYPTIEALAQYLAQGVARVEDPHRKQRLDERPVSDLGLRIPEPIAIIGIGCRFPGAASPEAFWQLLRDGIDAVSEVPADRWDIDYFYDPDPLAPGKMITRWGGFLERVDEFDAGFFGISPREAARMDPQQRLLMEVSWEALEDAGLAAEKLAGSMTGVFVGISSNDYAQFQFTDPTLIDAYAGTGNAHSIAANRLSFALDLQGPSLAVDTACSSSLVAVHMACQSMRSGECNLALAGGVNVLLTPDITINFTKAGVMAPDGRSKAFDARANGYVRGEGAGIVVLKPLSKALSDADSIYALIRGSAVNHDGRSNGLMAPSPHAQQAVIREAYQRAGISPGRVQYVEAHGTGTLLGDPIEAKALGAVLATDRPADSYCALGSVKTNIGHLEAAAGVAGLIKVALSLKQQAIPPSLHFQEPNPHIPFDELPLRVQRNLAPWPEGPGPALAGVSSFGFGGTNAHVVLQEPPSVPDTYRPDTAEDGQARLLPLSARSPEALRALAQAFQDFLATEGNQSAETLRDICYTASLRRSHHDHRLAVMGHSHDEIITQLDAFLQDEAWPGVLSGQRVSGHRHRLVFVFPGQGSQWLGMGCDLLAQEPVFRDALERCAAAIQPHTGWSLLEELTTQEGQSRLDEIDVIQPALFAIQVALAALWRSWGIEPDAVVGHSMGEVAAAHVAGALSLEDAARLVCLRSSLMKRTSGQGAMAAVGLTLQEAQEVVTDYEGRMSIAVSNSPNSTVLSGDPVALEEITEALEQKGIFCRFVKVDVAAHSPQMDPLRAELVEALEGWQPRPVFLTIYSTVTGRLQDGEAFDASYWGRNLREPVLFSATVRRLIEDGHEIFLEISPHPILLSAIQDGLGQAGKEGAAFPSLRRKESSAHDSPTEGEMLLEVLGALFTRGYPVDWSKLYPAGGRHVRLPSYPWQRRRYWLELGNRDARARWDQVRLDPSRPGTHPLLGQHLHVADASGKHIWETELDRRGLSYLEDHRVQGAVLVPGSAYLEMALAASEEVFGTDGWVVQDIEFQRPLFLPTDGTRRVQVILASTRSEESRFHIYSCPVDAEHLGESWICHVIGNIGRDQHDRRRPVTARVTPAEIQARCQETISSESYYRELGKRHVEYGPAFQCIEQIWRRDGEALAAVRAARSPEQEAIYRVHPTILDACFQIMAAAMPAEMMGEADIYMPSRIEQVVVHSRPEGRLWAHAHLPPDAEQRAGTIEGDVRLLDEAGQTVIEVLGLRFQRLGLDVRPLTEDYQADWLYELQWQPTPHRNAEQPLQTARGSWLILTDSHGIGEALATTLEMQGERCVVAYAADKYERVGNQRFRICPERPEHVRRLFEAALPADQPACQGIVHFWSLDTPPPQELTAASLEAAQTLSCGSTLHLVQALDRAGWREPPRLWLVTQGAQSVGEELVPLAVAQSPLWGLGRTIAQEHRALWGGLLDLEPGGDVHEAATLLSAEIRRSNEEDQIAFRNGERYAARLIRLRRSTGQEARLRWRADGSYLIAGGLGDLGLLVARWMAEQGARRLILLGRTGLPSRSNWNQVEAGSRLARQIAAIRELEAMGVSVHLAAVDVADEVQLGAFLEAFRLEGWPPIRGIIHAAAVLKDRILAELDLAALRAVLRPKMLGGWLLHRLFEDAPLDFFVMFSSAASLLSQPGQGNYAAANAFLDSLAYHRQALGRPALAVNWGAWRELGFAATPGGKAISRHLARLGIESIGPRQGLEVLGKLLRQSSAQVLVVPVNWQRYRQFGPGGSETPLLSQVMHERVDIQAPRGLEGVRSGEGASEEGLLSTRLLRAPAAERRSLLEVYLQQRIAEVLHMGELTVPAERNVMELGLDSIMVMELVRELEQDLQLRLYPREIFEQPSIRALAVYLVAELDRVHGEEVTAPPTRPVPSDLLSPLTQRGERPRGAESAQRNPSMVFLLSAPRSGSTLLRVMLAGHPALFCPPELHLLPFSTMQERDEELGATYLGEGLQRAFMELMGLDPDESKTFLDELTGKSTPVQQVYGRLQELAGTRLLVDKSPSYGASMETLEHAEALFEGAKYVFLVRHPYAVIDSCVRIRLERLFGTGDVDPYEFAEQVWARINGHVLDFLQQIDPERQFLVRYERLVSEPAAVAHGLCQFLSIPFNPALLQPYEGNRMTDGVHSTSLGIGDPNFLKRDRIDPTLGEVWKEIELPYRLGGFARRVATELQYDLPREMTTPSAGTGRRRRSAAERQAPEIVPVSRELRRVSISDRGGLEITEASKEEASRKQT